MSLVAYLADEDALFVARFEGQSRERGSEALSQAPPDRDPVAGRLNNRQIGSRLYISRHTVAFHLRQIFRKLQIGSRVELTRIVIERSEPH